MTKRKRVLAPRAKRMNRSSRLQSAHSWLKSYTGQNVAAGYRKHFGIDWVCAFKGLEMLGVKIDGEYRNKLLKSLVGGVAARRRRELRHKEALDGFLGQDQNLPISRVTMRPVLLNGVTWEEWEGLGREISINSEADISMATGGESQDIPF